MENLMDSKLASLAVAAAALPPTILQEAIQTAYDFHSSGGSAMYAFASNHGKIADQDQLMKLQQEVEDAVNWISSRAQDMDSGKFPEYADDAQKAAELKMPLSQYEIKLLHNLWRSSRKTPR